MLIGSPLRAFQWA